MTKTIAHQLAEFSHSLTIEDLPANVIEKAKYLILDTLGVCVSSAQMDFGEAAYSVVNRWGGTGESSLVGRGQKAPAPLAAFHNGILAHGQDYDDTHTGSVTHPSCVLVPAAVAAAERDSRSGSDLILGLVAGTEVALRVGAIAPNYFHQHGYHATSICCAIGAAVAAAKLSDHNLDVTRDTIGISTSFASGLLEYITAGSSVKRLHAGWAAQGGIVAADTAHAGFTGPDTAFEGQFGYYKSFLPGEDLVLEDILKDIGSTWQLLDIRPKLYPCCHYLQAFLDCVISLRGEGVTPENINAIECFVPQGAVKIVCEPWESRINLDSAYEAKFSLPFIVAIMFVLERAGPDEFDERHFSNAAIRDLMQKTSYEVDPNYDVKDMPARIEVILKDGSNRVAELKEVRGSSRAPFSSEDLLEKYRLNTRTMPESDRDQLAELILTLENQDKLFGLFPTAS